MAFNVRLAFAFVALFSFVYLFSDARAYAGGTRQDLKEIKFIQIRNTEKTLNKFPFVRNDFENIEKNIKKFSNIDPNFRQRVHVFVAETHDIPNIDVFFERIEAPFYCGAANCPFSAYIKIGDSFKQVIGIVAKEPLYIPDMQR